jgi:hypothetical protein
MDALPGQQMEFDFGVRSDETGLNLWRQQREAALRHLSAQIGLPLGRRVEVWLYGGIRLRGRLLLRNPELFLHANRDFNLELEVEGVPITPADIESCVRLEE